MRVECLNIDCILNTKETTLHLKIYFELIDGNIKLTYISKLPMFHSLSDEEYAILKIQVKNLINQLRYIYLESCYDGSNLKGKNNE